MKTSSYLLMYMCTSPPFSSVPFFLSLCLSAVLGVLSAAAALSPDLFTHLSPHLFACAIGVLFDQRFVCRCCLVFSPTKCEIATTSTCDCSFFPSTSSARLPRALALHSSAMRRILLPACAFAKLPCKSSPLLWPGVAAHW